MKPTVWLSACLAVALAGCGGSSSSSKPGVTSNVARTVIATGLDQPMQYIPDPSDASRAYVLERPGRVRLLVNDVLQSSTVLDLTSVVVTVGECGLAGMTFAPDFASSRNFYLYYNTQTGSQLYTRVTRFTMASDGRSASASGSPVFLIAQPYSNHKGGTIHFGPDGFLYLALGDGGSANDPEGRAQDPLVLLGKTLRIDPNGDDLPADADNNYRVPSSNPFVSTSGVRGEIWGFGFRNPFRWCFDRTTGAMILADVGQDAYEEIDYEASGAGGKNYGWRVREGLHNTGNAGPVYPATNVDPFLEYDHSFGHSITGGFIYRGNTLGQKDRYLFADFVDNRFWSVPISVSGGSAAATTMAQTQEISVNGGWNGVVSIDEAANGDAVVTELSAGRVSRLAPVPLP